MQLTINDIARPFAVEGAREVLAILERVTEGWTVRPSAGEKPPAIRLRRAAGHYAIEAALRSDTIRERTALSAACSLVVDLAEAMADQRPDMLCLHAGAVRLGDGLVVLPSRWRAGKSTLITGLASLGAHVVADDILPLVAEAGTLRGHALGVASRLRLPLPDSLPSAFRDYCAAHAGPGDQHYRYLRPGTGGLAAYGQRAPIKAFVFLDRGPDDAPASLHPAPKGATLEALLVQNFGVAASAGEILVRLGRLTETTPSFVLRYGALAPAADLLIDAFAQGEPMTLRLGPEATLPLPPHEKLRHQPCGIEGRTVRAPDIAIHSVHGRAFVVDETGGAILAADGIGGLILDLLEEPISTAEIARLLAEAFSDIAPATIRADVERFVAALAAHHFVTRPTGDAP